MNISEIKNEIKKHINNIVVIKEYIGRNKYDTYEAVVLQAYPNLFVVMKDSEKKSFSYADLLIKNIVIKPKK